VKLALATANPKKLLELQEAVAALGAELVAASDLGISRFPPEDGSTYQANARIKAEFVVSRTGLPSLADDSGLEVAALGGAPGVLSARFGGALTDGERVAYLLDRLGGVRGEGRQARFVSSLVLATPGGAVYAFEGTCAGEILEEPRGAGGFGYDPVFYACDLGRGFGEASAADKRRVSHRGRAVRAFLAWAATLEGQRALRPDSEPDLTVNPT
jgi:XTP/dITP diphosphohydrolase